MSISYLTLQSEILWLFQAILTASATRLRPQPHHHASSHTKQGGLPTILNVTHAHPHRPQLLCTSTSTYSPAWQTANNIFFLYLNWLSHKSFVTIYRYTTIHTQTKNWFRLSSSLKACFSYNSFFTPTTRTALMLYASASPLIIFRAATPLSYFSFLSLLNFSPKQRARVNWSERDSKLDMIASVRDKQ